MNKREGSAKREQETERRERLCSPRNKNREMLVCVEERERERGEDGKGGLLSASSDRREADPRQQVLEDRETQSQTHGGSDT